MNPLNTLKHFEGSLAPTKKLGLIHSSRASVQWIHSEEANSIAHCPSDEEIWGALKTMKPFKGQ